MSSVRRSNIDQNAGKHTRVYLEMSGILYVGHHDY